MGNRAELPENPLLLTFDDGCKDYFTDVLPVLLKYGLQGSFYVPMQYFKEKRS
ncbi:TPA: polysaccharide deacetylase family protein [Streptococcus suis]